MMVFWKKPDGTTSSTSIIGSRTAADIQAHGEVPSDYVEITAEEFEALQQPTAAELLSEYRKSARIALASTSVTMERIVEAVSLGNTTLSAADVVAWMGYRADLRAAVSASVVGTLPAKPPYPAGT